MKSTNLLVEVELENKKKIRKTVEVLATYIEGHVSTGIKPAKTKQINMQAFEEISLKQHLNLKEILAIQEKKCTNRRTQREKGLSSETLISRQTGQCLQVKSAHRVRSW